MRRDVRDAGQVPVSTHPRAFALYFERPHLADVVGQIHQDGLPVTLEELDQVVSLKDVEKTDRVMLLLQLEQLRREHEDQKRENLDLRQKFEQAETKIAQLKSSIVGHVLSQKRPGLPTLEQALRSFDSYFRKLDLHPTTVTACLSRVNRFVASLSQSQRSKPVDELEAQKIQRFLDTLPGESQKRHARIYIKY